MMTDGIKDRIGKLLREKLPILAVDLLIDGTRAAKGLADRSARLIADGTVPVPGFLLDMARRYVKELEDTDRLVEADDDWEARPFKGEPEDRGLSGKDAKGAGDAGRAASPEPAGCDEPEEAGAGDAGATDEPRVVVKAEGRGPAVWGKAIDKLRGGRKKRGGGKKAAGKAKPGRGKTAGQSKNRKGG